MTRNNRVCCVCGKEYYYCSNDCMDSINKPSWLGSFCCENCKDIYNACACYNIGKMTKDETKKILDNCDLSNKENFTPAAQRIISEIYASENTSSVNTNNNVNNGANYNKANNKVNNFNKQYKPYDKQKNNR